jgi:hypothetical protein
MWEMGDCSTKSNVTVEQVTRQRRKLCLATRYVSIIVASPQVQRRSQVDYNEVNFPRARDREIDLLEGHFIELPNVSASTEQHPCLSATSFDAFP